MENIMVWNLLPWHQVMLRMLRDCVSAKIKIFQVSLKSRHQEIKPNMKLLQNVEYMLSLYFETHQCKLLKSSVIVINC